jgi:SOS-response transcriptional repressor LexA
MDYHRHNGYSPSLREIACGIGVSLTTATAHVTALRGKGCIDWEPNSARSIHVVKQGAT